MLTRNHHTELVTYPPLIDPLSSSLEVKVSRRGDDGEPAFSWLQLGRMKVSATSLPFSVDQTMVHFFGSSQMLERSEVVLVYDSQGFIRARIGKDGDSLFLLKVPEEFSGRIVVSPSVRLTWAYEQEAADFLRLVTKAKSGKLSTGDKNKLIELSSKVDNIVPICVKRLQT